MEGIGSARTRPTSLSLAATLGLLWRALAYHYQSVGHIGPVVACAGLSLSVCRPHWACCGVRWPITISLSATLGLLWCALAYHYQSVGHIGPVVVCAGLSLSACRPHSACCGVRWPIIISLSALLFGAHAHHCRKVAGAGMKVRLLKSTQVGVGDFECH